MHDDQHIARLFLLDQGLRQGNLYPRWVGQLGFGYGYPLFNFYPPLIYYISEFFHLVGFSYIWSVKLMLILGFILAAFGSYWLIRRILGRWPAMLGATVYTYFFYHSVNVYVRGAFAEFFAMTVLPFVFLFLHRLYEKNSLANSVFFGISLALLVLAHPLIAFPAVIFIGFIFLFYLLAAKDKINFAKAAVIGGMIGLGLSAFFWLPSLAEKQYTLTDKILTTELAAYQEHFVCPYQFWYSPWGYGGSGDNCQSGLTFQLGKIPIALTGLSLAGFVVYIFKKKKLSLTTGYYLLSVFLLLFSLFMATGYSAFIWKAVSPLAYLQWPWRFLTFTALFISIICAYGVYFFKKLLLRDTSTLLRMTINITVLIIVIVTVIKYSPYFRPQRLISTTDAARTSFEEIAWRVSGTSYEFVPKGVATKKTSLGTTTLAINENDLPRQPYQIVSGQGRVTTGKNNFSEKIFTVTAASPLVFRLNTYYFPGWIAKVDGQKTAINDNNPLKLITVNVPAGRHQLAFRFTDTPVRILSDWLSIISVILVLAVSGWEVKNTLASHHNSGKQA